MKKAFWCEHLDKSSKITAVHYKLGDKQVVLKVQTWLCPHCGVHGAESELADDLCSEEEVLTQA